MLVLTHPHADHIGGAASVLRALRPAEVRDAAFVERSAGYLALLRTAQTVGTRWQRVRPGEEVVVDGVTLEFLAPDSSWTVVLDDPNEASTIVRMRYGDVSVLLTGDAEEREEHWLLEHAWERLASDVLKVGHHGSATSTSLDFLSAVGPRLALVSVGAGNTYRHPSADVMRRLTDHGATVLRTDQLGTVILRIDGKRIEVEAGGHRWTAAQPLPEAP
jgi:competence protein ComEC